MRILKAIQDKIYYFDNKAKWIVWILIVVIFLSILYIGLFRNNSFYAKFFYPDIKSGKLVVENRLVMKKKSRENQIKEMVEELLLGPIAPDIRNTFSKESKLLSCKVIDNIVYLNLNRATVLNIDEKLTKIPNGYHLFLESIVNTICFKYKQIKEVRFFIEGKEYGYLGNYLIEKSRKSDWTILKR